MSTWLASSLLFASPCLLIRFSCDRLGSPIGLLFEAIFVLVSCMGVTARRESPIAISARPRIVACGVLSAGIAVAFFESRLRWQGATGALAGAGFLVASALIGRTWADELRAAGKRWPALLFNTQFFAFVPLSAYFAIRGIRYTPALAPRVLAELLALSLGTAAAGPACLAWVSRRMDGEEARAGESSLKDSLQRGVIIALSVSVLVASVLLAAWQGVSQHRARLLTGGTAMPAEDPWLLVGGFVGVVGAVAMTWVVLLHLLNESVLSPLRQITLALAGTGEIGVAPESCREILALASELGSYRERMASDIRREEFLKVATQVAHDIRSPLAALRALQTGLGDVDAENRRLMDAAVSRIQDISTDLLERNRQETAEERPKTVEDLAHLAADLVAEKKLQFRDYEGVCIGFSAEGSAPLLAEVRAADLRRVLSNLINNAVEALPDRRGNVSVAACRSGAGIDIRITDDGKGMPPEVLQKAGRKGFTHGKSGGSGLGLAHARQVLDGLGGDLGMESQAGRGTSIVLSVPAVAVQQMEQSMDAVLVDDDPLVRMTWKIAAQKAGKRLRIAATPDELRGDLASLARSTPIYIDSDLGDGIRGEAFAEELRQKGFSEIYLATGYEADRFRALHWLKGVIGKDPPWSLI